MSVFATSLAVFMEAPDGSPDPRYVRHDDYEAHCHKEGRPYRAHQPRRRTLVTGAH